MVVNQRYWDAATTSKHAEKEIRMGLNVLNKTNAKIISFFGSARVQKSNKYFKHCNSVAKKLGAKGYAICSGGGPGIMLAANSGAMSVGAPSLGFKGALLHNEKVIEKCWTVEVNFNFMFVRRFVLAIKSSALVFYPGGFGTLNELYEYLTLMQTGMVDRVPIVLVNKSYWKGMADWHLKRLLKEGMISKKDLALIHYADTEDEVLRLIR